MESFKKRRRDGAGYSVPAAADAVGVSYKTMRDAIAEGQVKTVRFGKLERVTKPEVARLKAVFGAE